MGPTMLVVMDGFGIAPPGPGNAVFLAKTPNFDKFWAESPRTQLDASGKPVGLPAGQMGNSEVGHMNLGAGRVVRQSLTHIDHLIETGEFFTNSVLLETVEKARAGTLHIMGLVSDGGVHSDIGHLLAMIDLCRRSGLTKVAVHIFTDGRDTPPDSGLGHVRTVQEALGEYRIATVIGRYYAMDRDKRWDRVQLAYDAVVAGQAAHHSATAVEAVEAAYARGETDEFILPTVIGQGCPMESGDTIFFINFRADRAREISYAMLGGPEWKEFPRSRVVAPLHYYSMMQYGKDVPQPFAFELPAITDCLAEVLSKAGKTQYHTAETEKYPHVTYFFNATIEKAFDREDRAMVASPKVATYDLQPEMSEPELAELTVRRIREHNDDFILINFANPDMVGHTGIIPAAVAACEAADAGLGLIVEAVLAKSGQVIILADHGNAEVMIDDNGGPHTAHTTNPVPCVLVGGPAGWTLGDGGKLGDVAPTILELMGIPIPAAMTGQSLIRR